MPFSPQQAILITSIFFFLCLQRCSADIGVVRMSQENEQRPIFKHDPPKAGSVTFSFAKHFQDHMVLQRAPKRANIYGWSPLIGSKVIAKVKISDTKTDYYVTHVKEGPAPGVGKWLFTLEPMNITTPVSIFVASDFGSLFLNDVLFGDVWLCSGQSNMQFTVSMMINGSKEVANAGNYPNIRVMTVALTSSATPQYDLIGIEEKWSVASSSSVGGKLWTYFSAVCWLYGKAIYEAQGYPIGLIASDWGGTPVEAWSSPDALAKCHLNDNSREGPSRSPQSNFQVNKKNPAEFSVDNHPRLRGPQNNSLLWNAMIHPFLGMSFYGAIWYQGENDAVSGRVDKYNCTFPAMIEDWRSKFSAASDGQTSADFPFGFVQLAPDQPIPSASVGFPDIRWHQTADVGYVPNSKMPNVFMAVTLDLPDFNSPYAPVHPRDKEDVGHRLALSGLAVAYNHSEMYQGPFPSNATMISSTELLINYGSSWKLVIKVTSGFEVFCVPSTGGESLWIPTPILSNTLTTISVYLGVCGSDIQALRYAWRVSPCEFKACAVYSTTNSLPAPPFVVYAKKSDSGSGGIFFQFS